VFYENLYFDHDCVYCYIFIGICICLQYDIYLRIEIGSYWWFYASSWM